MQPEAPIQKPDVLKEYLLPALNSCPLQASPLYTSYKDLALSVEWHDLRALVLPGTSWAVIIGHKRRDDPLRAVLPLPLHTTSLRPSSLRVIYAALESLSSEKLPPCGPALVRPVAELKIELDRRRAERPTGTTLETDETPDIAQQADDELSPDAEEEEKDVGKQVGDEDVTTKNGELDPETLYLAITTTDSTVVYYKLSKGINKPADIPDE